MNVYEKAWLILANGMTFEGRVAGADAEAVGEICFATGMTGYVETLTDPSYYGQIVVQTFPLIGNCGVIPDDFESPRPRLSAYVARDLCGAPSNFRSRGALEGWLKELGVVCLEGVDTRGVARAIREHGVMNAAVTRALPSDIGAFARGLSGGASARVPMPGTGESPRVANPGGSPRVALWDFGAKRSLERELAERGCEVVSVPASAAAGEIAALRPDGVLLSNGPGDPAAYADAVSAVREVSRAGVPLFGVCLGHQLLALARGGRTVKLKYGHRGANQPVREVATGRLFVTSQNHGYAVDASAPPDQAAQSFVNVNDGTCEGLVYADIPAFSVQFHPEACAGPRDTGFLFDRFLRAVGEVRGRAAR